MDVHTCSKEAEIATLQAHDETRKETEQEHYEDLNGKIDQILVILRDGNGKKGLIERMAKVEDRVKLIGVTVLSIISTLAAAGIYVKAPWTAFIGG